MDGQIHVRFGPALDPFGNAVDDGGTVARPARARGRRAALRVRCRGGPALDPAGIASTRGSSGRRSWTASTGATPSCRRTSPASPSCRRSWSGRASGTSTGSCARPTSHEGLDAAALAERVGRLLGALRQKAQAGPARPPRGPGRRRRADRGRRRARARTLSCASPLERRGDRIHVGNPALVYYYRNRLAAYGLDPYPFLEPRARKGNRR